MVSPAFPDPLFTFLDRPRTGQYSMAGKLPYIYSSHYVVMPSSSPTLDTVSLLCHLQVVVNHRGTQIRDDIGAFLPLIVPSQPRCEIQTYRIPHSNSIRPSYRLRPPLPASISVRLFAEI